MGRMGQGKGAGKVAVGKGKGKGKGKGEEEVVAEGHGGGEGWLREAMEDMSEHVKSAEKWVESISKRASVMELRLMNQRPLVHESMRCIMNHLTAFKPMGDSGWILRSTQDSMKSAEFFLRAHYVKGLPRDPENVRKEIQQGLRIIVFEACRRVMQFARTVGLRKAYASIIAILRRLEEEQMDADELEKFGFFQWATNMNEMVAAMFRNTSSVRDAPDFNEVKEFCI